MTVFLLTDQFNIVWICGIRRNHGYVGAVRALFPPHPSLTVKNLNEQFEIHQLDARDARDDGILYPSDGEV